MERLQKVLANAGIASRRKAEQMILDGRVSVDGEVVRELGTQVDRDRQRIHVDGKPVRQERKRYILLNKPSGYITTAEDERGRYTVLDLVDVPERVVPVGRLDRKTEGLLLLTNDGELAYRVTHPKFELQKEYEVELDGHPPREALERLTSGIVLDDGRVEVESLRAMRNELAGTVLRIVIHEGRNRIVRRMFERIGYPARKLTRIRVGPLHLQGIPRGAWRELTQGELQQLDEAVQAAPKGSAPGATGHEERSNAGRGPRDRSSNRPYAGRNATPGRHGGGSSSDRDRRSGRRG